MKKKIYIVALAMALSCTAFGCGKKDSGDPYKAIRADLTEFVNEEITAIAPEREDAIGIYNSYFDEEKPDNAAMLSKLKETALPEMKSYIDKLNAIEVSTPEVEELRMLYVNAAQAQYDAMELVAKALEEENPDYLTEAKTKLDEFKSNITQYESKLKLLAADASITINGTLNYSDLSGGSDAQDETDEETAPEVSVEETTEQTIQMED